MEDNGKKLGVIGGLGPKASSYFYDLIIDHTVASKDQDHIDSIFLNHASMPDRTVEILSGNMDVIKSLLIKDALLLQSLGVSHIAIPCNTSHYFWKEIQDSVNIPVINMIEEVINHIRNIHGGEIDKVGVLATDGTIKTGIYDKECESNSIEVVYPKPKHQRVIMDLIYHGVKGGESVEFGELEDTIEDLRKRGCDAIIIGCTELSVLGKNYTNPYIIIVDALLPLARRAIELSGKQVKGF